MGDLMKFVVILIVVTILIVLIEKIINKMLGVQKQKLSETPGKKIDQWGRGIILVIFLSTVWFVITIDSDKITKLYWMSYLVLIFGFQAIMEFLFIKNSRQYISTTVILILGMILLYNIGIFPFLNL